MALHIEIPDVVNQGSRIKEGPITKKCIEWINTLPRTKCYKRAAGPGRKGKPDITGATHGWRVEIEMKAPGKNPTPIQLYWIKGWHDIGCIAGWCDNLVEFKRIVREGLATRGIHLPNRYFV